MIRFFTLLFVLIFILTGCASDVETITIERNGVISFNLGDDDEKWISDSFNFYQGQSVVKEFSGEPNTTSLFRRHYLVFDGTSPEGKEYELSISLDISDDPDMRHLYSTDYHPDKGGLHQISIILTEKSGNEKIYSMAALCPDSEDEAYFEIERQNNEENLIAGSLKADLCFVDSVEHQLRIFNAKFKDIEY